MLNGIYCHPTRFIFGKDEVGRVGEEVRKYADKVLLHYGQESARRSGLLTRVADVLSASGVSVCKLGGVNPNPESDLVREGIEICRKEQIGLVLAMGGGSVIDSAKAICVGVPYEGDFWAFFEQEKVPIEALKLGVVLTVPGAGSETSSSAVLTDRIRQAKNVCETPILLPVFAILDPTLTTSVPLTQTSVGIMDALSHVLERYFTNTEHVRCTDRICEGMLMTLMELGVAIQSSPESYDLRAEIMWACKLAHDNTPGFGRKQDWACHKIAHEIGAFFDAPHGAIMGAILPAWMECVAGRNPAKLQQFGARVFGITTGTQEQVIVSAIQRFRGFAEQMGLPTSLRALGVKDTSRFPEIARRAVRYMQSGTIGNYVRLGPDDIVNVLKRAY